MRIVFGTDERTALTDSIVATLAEQGHEVVPVADGEEWQAVGRAVGESVAGGQADRGVVCCWTGTGVSIAANKAAGIPAPPCTAGGTAPGAPRWNTAHRLALGLRPPSATVSKEMSEAFLTTDVDPDEGQTIARGS